MARSQNARWHTLSEIASPSLVAANSAASATRFIFAFGPSAFRLAFCFGKSERVGRVPWHSTIKDLHGFIGAVRLPDTFSGKATPSFSGSKP